jgi:transcriptional regulator GlxA family with amidase domain
MMIEEALREDEPQPAIAVGLKTEDAFVKKALLHMTQNMAAPLSIAEVARRVGLSRRSLERRFESDIHQNPGDAYLSLRLAQASLLLLQTKQTIAEVAASTGFCDASHLGRVFRRHQGMTPSQVRKGSDWRATQAPQRS